MHLVPTLPTPQSQASLSALMSELKKFAATETFAGEELLREKAKRAPAQLLKVSGALIWYLCSRQRLC